MKLSPMRLVIASVLTMVLARFVFIPMGERLAGISDSLFWQILPWLIIAAIWVALLAAIRRTRHEP